MPDPGPSISLVYPMYNERENIARALEHGVQALSSTTSLWEIIVVDDGSTDGGSEIVARFTRDYPNVRLISHDSNRGLGESLRSGFAQTRHEAVLYTDVDLPCDLSILRDVLPMLRKVDLVKGYRLNGRGSFLRAVYLDCRSAMSILPSNSSGEIFWTASNWSLGVLLLMRSFSLR